MASEFLIRCRLLRREETWGSRPEKSQGKEKKRLKRTAIGSPYDIEFEWTEKKSIKCDSNEKKQGHLWTHLPRVFDEALLKSTAEK